LGKFSTAKPLRIKILGDKRTKKMPQRGMTNPTLRLIALFVRIDDLCEEKKITGPQGKYPNTSEEKKLLKKRSIVETVIGKFKNFFGKTFFRFRSPQAALSAICAGVLAVNLGC
jgi:hypothetical protein